MECFACQAKLWQCPEIPIFFCHGQLSIKCPNCTVHIHVMVDEDGLIKAIEEKDP